MWVGWKRNDARRWGAKAMLDLCCHVFSSMAANGACHDGKGRKSAQLEIKKKLTPGQTAARQDGVGVRHAQRMRRRRRALERNPKAT